MSRTNQVCITCTQRDTCQYYSLNRTICVPVMTEQEMQFELVKSQEEVNALRQEVAEMNKEREFWQQVHIQASIAAMQAELSNPNNKFMMCEDKRAIIVRRAVGYGDALTAELKKRWKDEND